MQPNILQWIYAYEVLQNLDQVAVGDHPNICQHNSTFVLIYGHPNREMTAFRPNIAWKMLGGTASLRPDPLEWCAVPTLLLIYYSRWQWQCMLTFRAERRTTTWPAGCRHGSPSTCTGNSSNIWIRIYANRHGEWDTTHTAPYIGTFDNLHCVRQASSPLCMCRSTMNGL